MAEVVIANDDLVVLGGPASINLALDVGATGTRGSYIFNDIGKPTSVSFSFPPIMGDMYININPSDNEYLYLYQYKLVNGVLGWVKILRLVPNTVLLNPYFKFINGEAYTPIVTTALGLVFFRGILVSMAEAGLENEQVDTLDHRDLNVQFRVSGNSPVMSNLTVQGINTTFDGMTYIVASSGTVVNNYTATLNQRYLFARLKIAEFNENTSAVALVNGYRKVDFFATVGGRSEFVLDIDDIEAESSDPADDIEIGGNTYSFPGGLTITGHDMVAGDKIVYLSNGNTPITELTDGTEYFIAHVVDDTIVLSTTLVVDDQEDLVSFTSTMPNKTHSIINLGGIKLNV